MSTGARLVRGSFHWLMLVGLLILILSPITARAGDGTQNPTYFSNLTFGTAGNSPAITYFPVGTKQVFARWDYANVPVEFKQGEWPILRRQWYINGKLFLQKEDAWDFNSWRSSGRLTHVSIYDFDQGLTPGYYHVVVTLVPNYPAAQVAGDFVVASVPVTIVPPVNTPNFSSLTVSTSASAPGMNVFPAGTPLISARWNYANIPIGASMQRDWYINGMLFRSVQEPWSSYWGSSGRLTHVAIYDYQYGMASGNYRLAIYLRDNPSVRAEVAFSIGTVIPSTQPDGPTLFYNLTFSASPDGVPSAIFPSGTREIFARWDFNYVSPESRVLRRWYRNGVMWLERQEAWVYGTQGTVKNISIYDYQYGLLPGDYYVEISLIGYPNSMLRGYFTIS